jgi:hypothetical protein
MSAQHFPIFVGAVGGARATVVVPASEMPISVASLKAKIVLLHIAKSYANVDAFGLKLSKEKSAVLVPNDMMFPAGRPLWAVSKKSIGSGAAASSAAAAETEAEANFSTEKGKFFMRNIKPKSGDDVETISQDNEKVIIGFNNQAAADRAVHFFLQHYGLQDAVKELAKQKAAAQKAKREQMEAEEEASAQLLLGLISGGGGESASAAAAAPQTVEKPDQQSVIDTGVLVKKYLGDDVMEETEKAELFTRLNTNLLAKTQDKEVRAKIASFITPIVEKYLKNEADEDEIDEINVYMDAEVMPRDLVPKVEEKIAADEAKEAKQGEDEGEDEGESSTSEEE